MNQALLIAENLNSSRWQSLRHAESISSRSSNDINTSG